MTIRREIPNKVFGVKGNGLRIAPVAPSAPLLPVCVFLSLLIKGQDDKPCLSDVVRTTSFGHGLEADQKVGVSKKGVCAYKYVQHVRTMYAHLVRTFYLFLNCSQAHN